MPQRTRSLIRCLLNVIIVGIQPQWKLKQYRLKPVAHGDIAPIALGATKTPKYFDSWHSGALDHMSRNQSVFASFSPCDGHLTICIADGSYTKVARIGIVNLSKRLVLQSILFVLDLECNLLSIRKISNDFNYVTKFSIKITSWGLEILDARLYFLNHEDSHR